MVQLIIRLQVYICYCFDLRFYLFASVVMVGNNGVATVLSRRYYSIAVSGTVKRATQSTTL